MSYGTSGYAVEDYAGDHDAAITTNTLPIACLEWEPIVGSNVWQNITSDLRNDSVSIHRGKGSESEQFRAGTMSVTMDNRGRQFDPEYVLQSLRIPGTSGSYVATPDSAALSITGDIDILAKVSMDNWASATTSIVSKYGIAAQGSYDFSVTSTGGLSLLSSVDGTATLSSNSTVTTGFLAGSTWWIRATLDVDNGAAGHTTTFYTSPDGVTWTQLGAAVTVAGTTTIFDGNMSVVLGQRADKNNVQVLTGNIYYAEIRNGIAGTVVASPSFSASPWAAFPHATTSARDGQNNLWTLNGGAVIQGTPWAGNLRPNRRIRYSETFNGITYPLFTGKIDRYEQVYVYPNESNTVLSCSDYFKKFQQSTLPGGVFQAEIAADLPVAWWKLDEPVGSPYVYDTIGDFDLTPNGDPLLGSTQIVARDSGTACGLDDITDGFQKNGPLLLTGAPVTIEAVVQIDLLTNSQVLVLGQLSYLLGTGVDIHLDSSGGSTGFAAFEYAGAPLGGAIIIENTLDIWDAEPHHLVGTVDASGLMSLYIDGNLRKQTTATVGSFELSGSIAIMASSLGSSAVKGMDSGTIAHCVMYNTCLSQARISAHYRAMLWSSFDDAFAPVTTNRTSGQWSGDTAAARLNHVLDTISFSSTDRDFSDTGGSTFQATDLSGSVLSYCQKIEETEGGRFFVAASGKVTWRGRQDIWKPPFNLVAWTLGDLAPELPYKSLGLFLDESTIVNQARVSRVDGVLAIAKNVASVTEFSQQNADHTDLLHSTDAESVDHANFIVNQFANPVNKFPQIEISPRRDPSNLYPFALGLEIGTRLKIRRRPQGVGSLIEKEVIVEGIDHHIGSRMHDVTLFVSELDALKVWVLDDTTNSVLDSTTRLGW